MLPWYSAPTVMHGIMRASKHSQKVPHGIRGNGLEHEIVEESLEQKRLGDQVVAVQTSDER